MSDDSRRFTRVERIMEIRCVCEGVPFVGRVTDLGEGGAFVDTTNPLEIGAELDFTLNLPDDPDPIKGHARVVWHQPTVGMGLEFRDLPRDQSERIRFFVASVYFEGGEGETEGES